MTSTTFSPVISRPTNKEQLRPLGSTKPAFTTTHMERITWQPGYAGCASPQLHKASIVGDFWTDTLFNPIWAPVSTRPMAPSANMAPSSVYSSSPESLTADEDCTDSSFLSLSSLDFDSPPQTAASTDAVLGSARLSGAFEEDYDRPEASPNFVRKLLRRSKSLRRQARMRDGDFRDSDDERDFSVASDWDPVVRRPVAPAQPFPLSSACEQDDSETRPKRLPSRLSRRVKVPSPINTSYARGSTGTKSRRKEYEVEVGRVDGSELTSSSESGFDADDEHDCLRGGMKINAMSLAIGGVINKGNVITLLSTPPRKSYAAIVAASPPRTNTPESKVVVPQAVQAGRILEARRGDAPRAFEWRPFVEPFDV
ncbi:hypothetical protein GSI_15346 [Ganoderma sinense ZZ0214-1]|uniref:Uncharacterized protein n=1 Tax=Ganoderma sinense ZZ0214-1 TaxID=1077348 RepID=A0A2G8RMB2_9APHY|nr:hypothetical protein GSI_15346 [Ganoderma sinense ZZ0214-1]